MKDKKFTFSKIIVVLSWIIFVLCLIVDIISANSNVYDTSVLVVATSVCGAITGSTTIWYQKKATAENQYKLKMGLYTVSVDQQLRFNEEMLKLQKKYNVSEEELAELNEKGSADEFVNAALNSTIEAVDNVISECDAPDEIHSFNI